MNVIGIDLGGTNTKVGLVNSKGRILKRVEVPTEGKKGKNTVIKNIIQCVNEVKKGKVAGIGIGSPGPMNYYKGTVSPLNLSMNNVPLKKIIQKEFKLKTELDNDANCFTLGEALFGAAKGKKNVIGLTLGTGVGGGAVLNKRIYHGRGNAAELGHITTDIYGLKCKCGNRGCIEAIAAKKGILTRSKSLKVKSPLELYQLAQKGNKQAQKVFDEVGSFLGIGLTSIIYAYDPDIIVLGGKISESWKFFSKSMNKEIKKRYFGTPCKVVRTKLGRDAGILGAAALTLNF